MSRYQYNFRWKRLPALTSYVAEELLASTGEVEATLDLGLSNVKVASTGEGVILPSGLSVKRCEVEKALESQDAVYVVREDGSVSKVSLHNGSSYYKLKAVAFDTAPTLEIDGIHMHRIVGVTPWQDSKLKVEAAKVRRGMKVLDVCTGLGYTASICALIGAEVVSIEKNPSVLEVASYNPWSKFLELSSIKLLLADAASAIKLLEDESFDRVIHDPPRMALAGELYSLGFYAELHRVIKRGGALFHYVGAPGSKARGVDVAKGVSNRLRAAGFRKATVLRDLGGVLAYK